MGMLGEDRKAGESWGELGEDFGGEERPFHPPPNQSVLQAHLSSCSSFIHPLTHSPIQPDSQSFTLTRRLVHPVPLTHSPNQPVSQSANTDRPV